MADWDCVPPKVNILIPGWLKQLLASHSLFGPEFERPHEYADWERYFAFWEPSTYAGRIKLKPDDPIVTAEIINRGFIPISDESDGDMWVVSTTAGPSSPVHISSLTGLKTKVTSPNLAAFLASSKICDRR
jgi:hypothetical protein